MRRRWLVFAVIVTATSGCDNVAFGGIDVRLEPPPPRDHTPVSTPAEAEESEAPSSGVPEGPVLLAGLRDGNRAELVVVGVVEGDAVRPLPSESEQRFAEARLAPGAEFVLFSEGVRVGTLVADGSGRDGRFCGTHPTVSGTVELVPGAVAARRLLALPSDAGAARPYGSYQSYNHDYDQRVASLTIARETLPQVGAAFPPSLLESRADIQAFRLGEGPASSIAATFVVNDRLGVGAPDPGAYTLFIMGTEGAEGITRSYAWYRAAERDGKGAPRYFGHLDWNGDGSSEVLLDVFGGDARWFATLARRDGGWVRTFQDPCGARGAPSG